MSNRCKWLALSIVIVMLFMMASSSVFADKLSELQHKKLIASGWHMPSSSYVHEHFQEMEQLPFDGIIVGEFYPFWSNMRDQKDKLNQFVADMKSTPFKKFTDNFIGVESGNDKFDWFDDKQCQEIVTNWRLLARAVKQAGFKGIKFDPECYEGPSLYNYDSLLHKDTKSPEEYSSRISKVAADIITAINEEYPNITILYYFGPSVVSSNRDYRGWCGMMPAFVDGMLSNAKKGFKIVDGYEQAYGYRTAKQYSEARRQMMATAKLSKYPTKYRQHVQVGFAFWPDQMAGNPLIGRKSFDVNNIMNNYYLPDEAAYAGNNALLYSDEYVWMWAESLNVWDRTIMVYDASGVIQTPPIPAAYIESLYRAKSGIVSVPPERPMPTKISVTVKDLGETDDSKVFASLWSTYKDLGNLPQVWRFMPDSDNKGEKSGLTKSEFDDTIWPTINICDIWDQQGYPNYLGYAWYRVKYQAPPITGIAKVYLAFGAVDEAAYVYINGKYAGKHDIAPEIGFKETFLIDVTKYIKSGQLNVIAVKVKNTVGAGGIWRNIKLVQKS